MAFHWHVAQTLPRGELLAEQHLRQQGFVPFAPRFRVTKIVRGLRVTHELPYFGSYVFVSFDPDEDRWAAINSTRGVRTLLYASPERPARIPEPIMRTIVDQCDGEIVRDADLDKTLARVLWIGAVVRIVEEPLAGHRGPITLTERDRVKVLMTILGAARDITFPRQNVELA